MAEILTSGVWAHLSLNHLLSFYGMVLCIILFYNVIVVVLKKAYYVLKNSLCGLINNNSMQYDYLTSLVMSLCESVPVWQLEKLQPHFYKQ